MSPRAFVIWLLSVAILVASGVQVTFSTHRVRQMHMTLQDMQAQRDDALQEYSRLQLELAAVAAYQNIERTAEEQLNMAFPTDVQRIDP